VERGDDDRGEHREAEDLGEPLERTTQHLFVRNAIRTRPLQAPCRAIGPLPLGIHTIIASIDRSA
jgi:hypothetical protein